MKTITKEIALKSNFDKGGTWLLLPVKPITKEVEIKSDFDINTLPKPIVSIGGIFSEYVKKHPRINKVTLTYAISDKNEVCVIGVALDGNTIGFEALGNLLSGFNINKVRITPIRTGEFEKLIEFDLSKTMMVHMNHGEAWICDGCLEVETKNETPEVKKKAPKKVTKKKVTKKKPPKK